MDKKSVQLNFPTSLFSYICFMKHLFISTFILSLFVACSNHTDSKSAQIKNVLDSFVKAQKADFSIAIVGPDSGLSYFHQADKRMIMMSVVKFPQAVALLNLVDQGKLSLDSVITFDSLTLKRDTWSPLAKDHPYGDVKMTLRECFNYSVGQSDNIVCDRLYELLNWKDVTSYIQSLGIKDFGIATNYKNLDVNHLDVNFTSANAMNQLLKMIAEGKILSDNSLKVLLDVMKATQTGLKRLKGMVPNDVVIAHKTGTYYENDSFVNALNDVGIVYLPDGRFYCISVLVNNSYLTGDGTENAIAYINKLYYDRVIKP